MVDKNLGPVIKDLKSKGYSPSQIRAATGAAKSTISYHLNPSVKASTIKATTLTRDVINAYIRHQKETNPCSDCGRFYPFYVMQYDHRPEHEKLFAISRYRDHTKDIAIVKAEMEKCDLVCGNCHTIRGHWRRLESKGMIDAYEEYDF